MEKAIGWTAFRESFSSRFIQKRTLAIGQAAEMHRQPALEVLEGLVLAHRPCQLA